MPPLQIGEHEVDNSVVREHWLLTQAKEGYCLLTREGLICVIFWLADTD